VKFIMGQLWKAGPQVAIAVAVSGFFINTGHKFKNRFENRKIAAESYRKGYEACHSENGGGGGGKRKRWFRLFAPATPEAMTEAEFNHELDSYEPWFSPLLELSWPIEK